MWKRTGAHIVSETIEGETIVVNLLEGVYYSITGSGTSLWAWISSGIPVESIVHSVDATYSNVPQNVADIVQTYAQQLVDEKLIEKFEGPATQVTTEPAPQGQKIPFSEPGFGKFSDMEDVLKMDPIHDFDESGWPNRV